MKKILITFALLLTTLLTFGQDSPYYVRGISFELGYKDLKSNINWDDTSYKDCNILIKLTCLIGLVIAPILGNGSSNKDPKVKLADTAAGKIFAEQGFEGLNTAKRVEKYRF
jgi:hypothetical protein